MNPRSAVHGLSEDQLKAIFAKKGGGGLDTGTRIKKEPGVFGTATVVSGGAGSGRATVVSSGGPKTLAAKGGAKTLAAKGGAKTTADVVRTPKHNDVQQMPVYKVPEAKKMPQKELRANASADKAKYDAHVAANKTVEMRPPKEPGEKAPKYPKEPRTPGSSSPHTTQAHEGHIGNMRGPSVASHLKDAGKAVAKAAGAGTMASTLEDTATKSQAGSTGSSVGSRTKSSFGKTKHTYGFTEEGKTHHFSYAGTELS